ncbi:hypothetical protein KA025_01735 [Candidatus Saccharibacteria bacterium]|jgi:hypothetical protein|nr:hypothetical protein [Candidatus Saccharibacteria bacterium]MBP7834786.1 hypothetical protein [Candidatus Saccharibacteria bacterium]
MSETGNFEHLRNFISFCEAEIIYAGLEKTNNMISAKLFEVEPTHGNDIDNIS